MNKYTVLINKQNAIKPSHLKKYKLLPIKDYDGEEDFLEEETHKAYKKLCTFLKKKNIEIALNGAYRTIEHQQELYKRFQQELNLEDVSFRVAKPMTSEHHTGLALDFTVKVNGEYIRDDEEIQKNIKIYQEIATYLPKFGFILRYPKDKVEITGYQYEPWHIRYVGVIPAKIMAENNWTLEEYLTKLSGVIYVNKPSGITSFDVVNTISNIFGIKKVGHTGTLDPLAEGVLVVTLGKATKIAELLTAEDKEYIAGVLLGVETDTLDITGKVIKSKPVDISKDIEKIINSYQKTYHQEVPIYSAIKVKGKKLYEYARENKKVELPKKEVTIKEIKLLSTDNDTFLFKALVTKGCYIRSLIRDIGKSLDTYATMTTLTRTKQGKVDINQTNTLEEIKQGKYKIHTIDEVLNYPVITLEEDMVFKIRNGQKIPNIYHIENKVIFKNQKGEILGIYKRKKEMLRTWKNF